MCLTAIATTPGTCIVYYSEAEAEYAGIARSLLEPASGYPSCGSHVNRSYAHYVFNAKTRIFGILVLPQRKELNSEEKSPPQLAQLTEAYFSKKP